MASIEVLNGAAAGRRFELRDELYIGRALEDALDRGNFLVIPEVAVSRHHARIRRAGDRYVIEDLESTNGTVVGAHRIVPRMPYTLSDGTPIRVSTTRMVFHADPAARGAASAAKANEDTARFDITMAIDARELQDALRRGSLDAGKDAARALERLKAITRVSIELGAVRHLDELVERVMACVFDVFSGADRAFLMLRAPGERELRPVAERERAGRTVAGRAFPVSRTILEHVADKRQALLSVDTRDDERLSHTASVENLRLRSVMCAPLLVDDEVLGVVQLDARERAGAFTGDDLEVFTGICTQIAIAVKNFQLYEEIDRLFESFIRASVQTIEARDPVTAGHSFRVARYTERLARAVDRETRHGLRGVSFSAEQIREIRYAALLHDFGKVTVREDVLTKEKKLHAHELALLEERFKHARACLEARAYRELATLHARKEFTRRQFAREHRRLERRLAKELLQLKEFQWIVASANEPSVLRTNASAKLDRVAGYCYADSGGREVALLQPDELAALKLAQGSLTPREREEIQAHVRYTYSFLSLIPWTGSLSNIADIAHGHHEKLDGSGYPRGLRGADIPIQTRMLTIADIYDALSSGDRPYKEAIPPERTLDILKAEARAGKIDKALFKVFVASRAYETP